MKTITALLVGLIPCIAWAADADGSAVTFSKYSPEIRLVAYDEQTHTHKFTGTIKLVGTLFLEFDMEAPDRANGEINVQKFVPDSESAAKLPAVVGGFYPSAVRYISLDTPVSQLETLFGGKQEFIRISHGASHSVSKRVSVVVRHYIATVECDSRVYGAKVVSIAALKEPQQFPNRQVPHGC
jgi:hypothetical protein